MSTVIGRIFCYFLLVWIPFCLFAYVVDMPGVFSYKFITFISLLGATIFVLGFNNILSDMEPSKGEKYKGERITGSQVDTVRQSGSTKSNGGGNHLPVNPRRGD